LKAQRMVLELLNSDVHEQVYTPTSELAEWSARLGLGNTRFPKRAQPAPDLSHPAIAVKLDACIQCTRCLRACREVQANNVIGYAGRSAGSRIVFDIDDPMGESSCVGCGECVQACPTGALMPADGAGLKPIERTIDSLCPYCGVGCQLTYHIGQERIHYISGKNGPANQGRLCVKGRYGFDYVHHRERLSVPLIRRADAPKQADLAFDPDNPFTDFREADWEEALTFAASG
ncbi:MAG: 4Fe-4S dicluster domain-containing protein, partial [Gammaproteobacteria bacterium]|nr:4Fe-4S dicluster domain-containing protein [Gammaproteobacteria bacterium]